MRHRSRLHVACAGRIVQLKTNQKTHTTMDEKTKNRLLYVEETYAGETETWLDPVTGDHYHIPIRIVRDWDDAEKL